MQGAVLYVCSCVGHCACVGLCVHGAVRPYLGLYVQAWGTRCVHAWAWVCMSVGHSCATTNCAHPGMRHVGQCAVADGCQLCACVGQCVHACGCVCMHEAMPACVGQFRAWMKQCLHVWGSFEHTWASRPPGLTCMGLCVHACGTGCMRGAVRDCMGLAVGAWMGQCVGVCVCVSWGSAP